MTPYSYRKIPLSAILLLFALFFAGSARAQYGTKREATLRGTAVLENANEGYRLIPICIFSNGKFYDADFYQSTPVPMSLIQDTIYEVQKAGEPIGNFRVADAERVGAVWYGRGGYNNFSTNPPKPVTAAKQTVTLGDTGGSDDRPVLHRAPHSSDTVDPKTPDSKSSDSKTPAPDTRTDSGPDDRPVLRRSTPPPTAAAEAPKAPTPDVEQKENSDPDRPTLKRGTQAPAPAVAGPREDAKAVADRTRRIGSLSVAVSDSSNRSTRPFDYHWDPQQKQHLTELMTKMASEELAKAARSRGVGLGAKDKITFSDVNVRAFDVDYSNNPQLVATMKFTPTMRQVAGLSKPSADDVVRRGIVVTIVARVNYNEELERISANVSDPRDLDASPMLELVDAVDVDADNRAELLFARIGDSERHFVVYRLYGLQMNELFTSGPR